MFCLHGCLHTTGKPGACGGQKEGTGFPGTGIREHCGLPYRHWEGDAGLVQEQPGLVIVESFLMPESICFHLLKFSGGPGD